MYCLFHNKNVTENFRAYEIITLKPRGSVFNCKIIFIRQSYRSTNLSDFHVCQKVNALFIARIVTEAAESPNNRFIYRNLGR